MQRFNVPFEKLISRNFTVKIKKKSETEKMGYVHGECDGDSKNNSDKLSGIWLLERMAKKVFES